MKSNRRKFLQTSATATAALMLSSLDKISSATQPSFTMNKNYELKIMATNWGFDGTQMIFVPKQKKKVMMESRCGGPLIIKKMNYLLL